MTTSMQLTALDHVPEVKPGDSLAEIFIDALAKNDQTLANGDVVVLCQKIVSKAEGRFQRFTELTPSAEAQRVAELCQKDPTFVEAVLRESSAVIRTGPNMLIVRHRLGFIMANAGIDQSNIGGDGDTILLLPVDPDASAAKLRDAIKAKLGVDVGVVITDSFGRAWRLGVTGVCIGAAGLIPLVDERGKTDRFGRELKVTMVAVGDAIACAAMLLTGEGAEGRPIVVMRGLEPRFLAQSMSALTLLRPAEMDMFL